MVVKNPKVDLELSFTINLGQFESLRIGMRVSDIEVPSASDEDVKTTRKAINKQILTGMTDSFTEINEYLNKEFFTKVKELKQTFESKRKEA